MPYTNVHDAMRTSTKIRKSVKNFKRYLGNNIQLKQTNKKRLDVV